MCYYQWVPPAHVASSMKFWYGLVKNATAARYHSKDDTLKSAKLDPDKDILIEDYSPSWAADHKAKFGVMFALALKTEEKETSFFQWCLLEHYTKALEFWHPSRRPDLTSFDFMFQLSKEECISRYGIESNIDTDFSPDWAAEQEAKGSKYSSPQKSTTPDTPSKSAPPPAESSSGANEGDPTKGCTSFHIPGGLPSDSVASTSQGGKEARRHNQFLSARKKREENVAKRRGFAKGAPPFLKGLVLLQHWEM